MRKGPKKTVAVLMPMELYEQLRGLAEHSSRSLPSYIRQILTAHLQYMERFRKF